MHILQAAQWATVLKEPESNRRPFDLSPVQYPSHRFAAPAVESTNRRKSRFSEERIVALLKQAGECRRFGCPRLSLLLRRGGPAGVSAGGHRRHADGGGEEGGLRESYFFISLVTTTALTTARTTSMRTQLSSRNTWYSGFLALSISCKACPMTSVAATLNCIRLLTPNLPLVMICGFHRELRSL